MRRSVWLAGSLLAASFGFLAWYVESSFSTGSFNGINSAEARNEQTMNSGILEVSLGEQGAEVIKHSQVPIKRGEVAGLAFYESSDIENRSEPIVRLRQGNLTLDFPIARSVLLTAAEKFGEGVENVDIDLKLSKPPKDSTNELSINAYDRATYALVMEVIERIDKAGWKRYIDPSEPRLSERITYPFQSTMPRSAYQPGRGTTIHPDPNYRFGFEEWQSLPSTTNLNSWQWYADGVFITLAFSKAPREAGVPMIEDLRITIQSERMRLAAYDPTQKGDLSAAQKAYREASGKRGERRHAEEAKARAAGLKILEDWVDPPFGNIAVPGR